jgi:hypothetical protein
MVYRSQQRLGQYLLTRSGSGKYVTEVLGAELSKSSSYSEQRDASFFAVPSVCKYRLSSETNEQGVFINIKSFSPRSSGRLRIFGGLTSEDNVLFDSNAPLVHLSSSSDYAYEVVKGVGVQRVNVTAPCGLATVLLEVNNSDAYLLTNASQAQVDYSLQMSYHSIAGDDGYLCRQYCTFSFSFCVCIFHLH